ncbi:hypothetical protein J2S43_000938 [Catenuloplanes nepalensis]|uniref:Secreted protein n=1 Tax=Catenuloplanes nepalensis TaxID=587533 RepID=A0ABT9MMY9_9ACTN|nr:hypothetical protein [Catenuloplanes nepalensis]MDP9792426.1 hypothetical protein [Catenuloplanes nepalensis]
MTVVDDRLNAIRGAAPRKPHNARTLAALAANPGCRRRTIMDAAGVNKALIADRLGHGMTVGQMSSIALARGRSFEAQVKAEGGNDLLRLLREHLDLPTAQAHYHDLNPADDDDRISARLRRSQSALEEAARASDPVGTMFDHPILQLTMNGVRVHIEPDLIAFKFGDRFHIVEIKSFPIVDGVADSGKVAAAAQQAAVYVLAMREMLQTAGLSPELVSHEVILVCPRDFSNQPVAELVDVRKPLASLRRHLTRMESIDALLPILPPGLTFDLVLDETGQATRSPDDLAASVAQVSARYSPDCLQSCELAGVCRAEADGTVPVLGRVVREELGGIDSIAEAIALATGGRVPDDSQRQAARLLRSAYQMRQQALEAVR